MRPSFAVFMFAAILASESWAQSALFPRGIDTVPLKLSPSLNSGLVLDGAELERAHSWLLQAVVDVNVGVLSLRFGNEPLGELIPLRTDVHIMGAYQPHSRVELAADLPVTVYQRDNFQRLETEGFPQTRPAIAGLGAPRLQGRFQILRQSEIPIVGLAAVLEVRIPVGDQASFLSDRGFVIAPRVAIERELGPLRLLANVGWRLRTSPGQFMNLFVRHEFTLGGGAIVTLPESGTFRQNQLLAEANVATPAEAPFTARLSDALKTPLEVMIGARTVIGEHWRVQLSAGKGLGETGYGRETLRVSLSVGYLSIPPPDRDGDGIPDAVDGCPDDPEDKDGYQDEDGCPEYDRDGDGVRDEVDMCPDTPGPRELQGCPDRDGDQIPDISDKCPDEPGPPEHEGCPPPPEEEHVVLESERIKINNQILFEFGSDRIDRKSFKILDEVAQLLRAHPEVAPVLIEGHTDSVGSRPFNLDLSKRRARAVERYLITKGIAGTRLKSAGFGFDRPVVPNDSPLNRAKNRRTEFKLVDDSKPVTNP